MSAQEETVSTSPETPASEPVSVANNAAPESGTSPEAAAATERDEKGKFRNPLQPRIDELTRARRESEREAAYWRQRAEAKEKADAPPPPEKPTPEKFDNYNDYVEALAEFKADERLAKALEARDKQSAEKQTAETRKSTWAERATKALEVIPDYDQVMSTSDVPVADHVLEILQDSEEGPRVAYHLAKNPALADQLNQMTPTQAARKIGALEASLPAVSAKPEPEEEAPPTPVTPARRTTNAPPPVKPVASSPVGNVPLAKMSMDDYVKARKAQGASWAR